MDQHPIPQQISSYEFKLVGEMTLKQFLKAAIGIILAVMINSTKIIFIIKWPIMIGVAGLGIALAFVPFQDRPLESWLIAFIKSIYSPTIYTYKKKTIENWLDLDLSKKLSTNPEDFDFSIAPNYQNNQKNKFKLKIGLGNLPDLNTESSVEKIEEEKQINQAAELVINQENSKINEGPQITTQKNTNTEEKKVDDWRNTKAGLNLKSEKLEATGMANFGAVNVPNITNVPNVVTGMITSKEGKLMEGVIVEVQDEAGNPVRVLKTNPLGHFKTSTPLPNGKYLVVFEKDNYNFDRINISLEGQILQSLRVTPTNN